MTPSRADRQPLVPSGQIEHHVADLSATFAAEVTLAVAQQKLRENGQWLPIDGDPEASLGSVVERNSTGPLRLGFGAWRDLLLGVQFTNGRGELITAGGRTVKNVAGYDLTKFMVGQFGVFGKIVTLTTRTYKAPEAALIAQMPREIALINTILVTPCRPQWALLTKRDLYFGYVADEKTIAYYESAIYEFKPIDVQRQSLDEEIAFRAAHWRVNGSSKFRASVPPSNVLAFMQGVHDDACVADPVFGIVIGSSADPSLTSVAKELGGSMIVDDPKQAKSFFGVSGQNLALLQRLETAFNR